MYPTPGLELTEHMTTNKLLWPLHYHSYILQHQWPTIVCTPDIAIQHAHKLFVWTQNRQFWASDSIFVWIANIYNPGSYQHMGPPQYVTYNTFIINHMHHICTACIHGPVPKSMYLEPLHQIPSKFGHELEPLLPACWPACREVCSKLKTRPWVGHRPQKKAW